jgi:hypothetical protein
MVCRPLLHLASHSSPLVSVSHMRAHALSPHAKLAGLRACARNKLRPLDLVDSTGPGHGILERAASLGRQCLCFQLFVHECVNNFMSKTNMHCIFSSACRCVVFIRTTLALQLAQHTSTTMSGGSRSELKAAQRNSLKKYSANALNHLETDSKPLNDPRHYARYAICRGLCIQFDLPAWDWAAL